MTDTDDLTEVELYSIPTCSWCSSPAEYDFKTNIGPWAYGCSTHWEGYRLYPTLGLGKGQKLLLAPRF